MWNQYKPTQNKYQEARNKKIGKIGENEKCVPKHLVVGSLQVDHKAKYCEYPVLGLLSHQCEGPSWGVLGMPRAWLATHKCVSSLYG